MDRDEPITKRLHISGLTPALTPADLSKRLGTYGKVHALDGFGLSDGIGQPRKFGYVTIESTQGQLAKCLNVLSGSTWKGSKLRIGDAKPDFAARLEKEREDAASLPPPKKKVRYSKYTAVPAEDMSLVTPENASTRPGWTVTPSGRILKPMRMRPGKPLPPVIAETTVKPRTKGKDEKKTKKKKKLRDPEVRARKRTIDVTRWGGQPLKGVFLGVVPDEGVVGAESSENEEEVAEEAEEEEEAAVEPDSDEEMAEAPKEEIHYSEPARQPAAPAAETTIDFAQEKAQTLGLLQSLFGGKDENDWVGRESVGSDIDVDESRVVVGDREEADYEIVPVDEDVDMAGEIESSVDEAVSDDSPPPPPTTSTKLKDLFAPREDEGGFSLLGHLDLDLELDEEMPFSVTTAHDTAPAQPHRHYAIPTPTIETLTSHISPLTLDPRKPLFFPSSSSFSSSSAPLARSRGPRDILDVARENGWYNSNVTNAAVVSGGAFYRTQTEDEIRKAWEEAKVELTIGWKKRWREAGKVRRRRGGVDEDV